MEPAWVGRLLPCLPSELSVYTSDKETVSLTEVSSLLQSEELAIWSSADWLFSPTKALFIVALFSFPLLLFKVPVTLRIVSTSKHLNYLTISPSSLVSVSHQDLWNVFHYRSFSTANLILPFPSCSLGHWNHLVASIPRLFVSPHRMFAQGVNEWEASFSIPFVTLLPLPV